MAYTTISKSTDYFNTKLYTGNGGTNAITGVGFQPDWVWVKNRDIGTDAPTIYDAVRGATKRLQTSSTGAESTKTNGLTAFDSDGYTAGSASAINANGSNLVAWNWKANGAGSSNTDGSITSTVSANTTAGFSIVKYTGTGSSATVGHGLGASPNIIMNKKTSGTQNWNFQNSMLGYSQYMGLNTVEQSQSTGGAIISAVSSTTFTCDGNANANASGETYVAYCFADVTGYSRFGYYTGNGATDGPMIYTGFKPAFIIIKRTDDASGRDWFLFDNKRDTENPLTQNLEANNSDAEYVSERCNFLSNGFKLTSTSGGTNASSANHIYMAFAAAPLVGSNNVPCTAR